MNINGKEYKAVVRTSDENKRFLDLLKDARDNLSQSLSAITYPSFETINQVTKEDIKDIIDCITEIEYQISNGYDNLYKPEKV